MKKGWQTKNLADLCEVFADGDWIESKDQASMGVRLIQTGNVGEGVFKDRAEKARYISDATFTRLRCTEVVKGDCLVSRLPEPVGRSCILPETRERMITAVDCTILRFKQGQILPTFFNLYSQSDDYLMKVAKACTGTTRNRISRSNLGLTPIPVPPMAEQDRIVRVLDEAFAGIATAKANAEQNLADARAIFESHLESVFSQRGQGWVEHRAPLSDLCELIVDCEHKTAPTQEAGYPSIRTPNIGKGKLLLEGVNRVSEETYRVWTRRAEPAAGDLILAREAPAGNVAVIPENTRVCLGQRTVLIRPRADVFDPAFLAFRLLEPGIQKKLLAHSRGATVQHVNLKDIRALDVGAIPPLPIQQEIAANVNAVSTQGERLARLYERKLAALDALKKSLLHEAFSGNL